MPDAYLQYECDDGVIARWHGGEYVELGWIDSAPEGLVFHAQDVINVWDHAENRSRIPFTLDALRECVDVRLTEDDE